MEHRLQRNEMIDWSFSNFKPSTIFATNSYQIAQERFLKQEESVLPILKPGNILQETDFLNSSDENYHSMPLYG